MHVMVPIWNGIYLIQVRGEVVLLLEGPQINRKKAPARSFPKQSATGFSVFQPISAGKRSEVSSTSLLHFLIDFMYTKLKYWNEWMTEFFKSTFELRFLFLFWNNILLLTNTFEKKILINLLDNDCIQLARNKYWEVKYDPDLTDAKTLLVNKSKRR